MKNLSRNHPKEQEPSVRAKNFLEVVSAFEEETAVREAGRCLNCKNAPCKQGCPVGVRIPEFLSEIKEGNFSGAYKTIKETNSLPAVCGRVCPQETQCEERCIRAKMEGAVAIGALERFVADYAMSRDGIAGNCTTDKQNDHLRAGGQSELSESLCGCKSADGRKSVAVVGSGPAGLAAAAELSNAGFSVTVFEAFHKAGGVLVYGIPEFRLPKDIVDYEIGKLKSTGVEIRLNTVVGKTVTVEQLLEEFDAVFIGSGAGLPRFLNIPGESLPGVLSANELLTRVNLMKAYLPEYDTPVRRGGRVAVFGAGNVAMDAARTALRLGASEVTVVYRRGREEMPARAEEILHAEQEGVRFRLLTAPLEILGENGAVTGVRCAECRLSEPGADGRRISEQVEGSEFVIPAETVVVAVGTNPNPLIINSEPRLKTGPKGTLLVSDGLETTVENVFAGGDAVTGAATVILAMGAGRQAAKNIIERLKGGTQPLSK